MERKYKLGYCMAVIAYRMLEEYTWLKGIVRQCEKFVLGIPDEWIVARLYGDSYRYSSEETKQKLLAFGLFSDVVILGAERLPYRKIYEEVAFDACFYGSEYGISFEKDRIFMQKNEIAFIPLLPAQWTFAWNGGALGLALESVRHSQKIILIGAGEDLELYMREYGEKYKPSFAVDSDKNHWNSGENASTKDQNILCINSPDALLKEDPAAAFVVLCGNDYENRLLQLKCIGNFDYRTMLYQNEIALLEEFAIASAAERLYVERAHSILMKLIKEFVRVCEKYKIRYYVVFGSLIGAVRHHGMVPWDDDIDIAIPRKDYKKLKQIAEREWNNDTFLFLNYDRFGNGAFHDFIPRLLYMKERLPTKVFQKVSGKAKIDVADRMFLDFFIMDNAHEKESVHVLTTNLMKGIYNLCMGHRTFIDYKDYEETMPKNIVVLMKLLHTAGRFLPLRFLTFLYETLGQSANRNGNCSFYFMEGSPILSIERRFDKALFGEGTKMPFGDIKVRVPEDFDGFLGMIYYDYRNLPALSARKPSHYFNSDIEMVTRETLVTKFSNEEKAEFKKRRTDKKERVEIPDEWRRIIRKPDGSRKKVILYHITTASFMQNDRKMLEKIRYILSTFQENQEEVALLWRPDSSVFRAVKSMWPRLSAEYETLINDYRTEGWGIYDDSDDINRVILLSDAYYGDRSDMVQTYQRTGKPIMIQNVDILD